MNAISRRRSSGRAPLIVRALGPVPGLEAATRLDGAPVRRGGRLRARLPSRGVTARKRARCARYQRGAPWLRCRGCGGALARAQAVRVRRSMVVAWEATATGPYVPLKVPMSLCAQRSRTLAVVPASQPREAKSTE